MKVRFEFQIDDLIDVNERTLAASRVVKKIRLSGLLSSSVLGAIGAYAASTGAGPVRPLYIMSGAILCAVAYPLLRKSTTKRRLRAFWRERFGSDPSYARWS